MANLEPTVGSEPGAEDSWIKIVHDQVRSLRFGLVQIIVHDGRVTQIERTERVRLEKQRLSYEI